MVGNEKAAATDCQNVEKMVGSTQARRGSTSGGGHRQAGTKGKLAAPVDVEERDRDKFIVRVGSIGCSAFGLNQCSFIAN